MMSEHLYEEKLELPSSAAEPTRRDRSVSRYTSPYYVVPATVLVIHTLLLVFIWTFFAMTIRGPIPFPPNDAVNFQNNMQTVIYVVSLISMAITVLSTSLYSSAIRYALTRRLANVMSLNTLVVGFKMAGPDWLMSFSQPFWMIGTGLCYLAATYQVAGYTALLLPTTIVLKSNMTGFELDFTSPDFQKLFATNAVTPAMFSRVLPVAESSGDTAVSARYLLPSVLNFNHFTYFNSTRGILPVAIQEIDTKLISEWGTNMPINVKNDQKTATPPDFPVSFTMTQQGFSADVNCTQQNLDTTTIPSLTLLASNQTLFNQTITLAQLKTLCPNSTAPDFSDPVLTSANADAFFGASCDANETSGLDRRYWNLILTGSGLYKEIKTTVCSIYPKVSTLTVDYSDNTQLFNSSFTNFVNSTGSTGGVDAPWLGDFVINIFLMGLTVGQSTSGSSMGDTILAFVQNLPNGSDNLSDILSQYVRGVLELGGTFVRTMYTQNENGLYAGGSSVIPPSMRIATNGTYYATTLGFDQSNLTTFGLLIAPTVTSLISIILVIVVLVTRNREEPEENQYFDPGEILHLISAASAGGMQTTIFPPFDEIKDDSCANERVRLGPVNGVDGRIGFIGLDG
jgi:hypothetical protein